MDTDKIDDIELLRKIAKSFMVKVKKEFKSKYNFTFHKGEYYPLDQYANYITIYSDDYKHSQSLNYDEAEEYLERWGGTE